MSGADRPDPADPVALARALVACPSVTPAEGGALALLEALLSAEGFRVDRPVFSEPDTAAVENLFARIGTGGPTIALAGHTDVVPPGDEARWRHPPFAGAIEDGVLHGRGAVDMKGGLAAMVSAAVRRVRAAGGAPAGSIAFLVTGDEEGPSVNGTVKLLAWCRERGETFDGAVVGEPTCRERLGDTIKVGRRGALSGVVTVHGRQGHAAYPEKALNPIPPLLAIGQALIAPYDGGNRFFQPTNLEIVSVDTGNAAFNVIPAEARLAFNVRFNDRWSVETLSTEIRRRVGAAAGDVPFTLDLVRPSDVFLTQAPGLVEPLAEAVAAVTGLTPERTTGGGTSDARHIKDVCPVVEFGLVGDTMHQVDERVPVKDLETLAEVYGRFLDGWFGRG